MTVKDYQALEQDLAEIRNRLYHAEQELKEAHQLVDQMSNQLGCLYDVNIREKD